MTRLICLFALVICVWSCGNLRLNQIQLKATHNSYHIAEVPAFPDVAYTRANLTYQLADQGVRGLELDWSYANATWTVSHSAMDPLSNCPDLPTCWGLIKAWIDSQSVPPVVFIWTEAKDDPSPTVDQWNAFDALARKTFGDGIMTPDVLRQKSSSPLEQVLTQGWPTLASVSGKVVFILDETYAEYITPNLQGRVAFPSYDPTAANDTNAVFLKMDEDHDITPFVQHGYMVRTFAEGNVWPSESLPLTDESIYYLYFNKIAAGASTLSYTDFIIWALSNGFTLDDIDGLLGAGCPTLATYNVSSFACFIQVEEAIGLVMPASEYVTQAGAAAQRDYFISSGAQLIYTDYPEPGQLSNYSVSIGNGTAQPFGCNPVLTSSQNCSFAIANDFTACDTSSAFSLTAWSLIYLLVGKLTLFCSI